jgi:hypothetical protein
METAIRKANILIEALPYIRSFRNKIVVIKFGGSAMSSEDVLTNVLQDIVFMKTVGIMPILVHGGGPRISEEMAKRNLTPKFIEGHRITDRETLDIAKDVLINEISASIVKRISELGNEAACIWGIFKPICPKFQTFKIKNLTNFMKYFWINRHDFRLIQSTKKRQMSTQSAVIKLNKKL